MSRSTPAPAGNVTRFGGFFIGVSPITSFKLDVNGWFHVVQILALVISFAVFITKMNASIEAQSKAFNASIASQAAAMEAGNALLVEKLRHIEQQGRDHVSAPAHTVAFDTLADHNASIRELAIVSESNLDEIKRLRDRLNKLQE